MDGAGIGRRRFNLPSGTNDMRQLPLFPFPGSDADKTIGAVCDRLGVENNTPGWPDRFGAAIRRWLEGAGVPPIRTLSLFSGAGGMDIGFSDAGFDIINSVEIEKRFCNTLELNTGEGKCFRNSTVSCVDIREFSGEGLGEIDFIIGGPPCQTFSAAGRRANGVPGTTDERGVLFREYVRLLRKLSPRGFLFENVYGIVGAQGGSAWKEIRDAFLEVGYKLHYRVVDAADYGVPQHRERLLIVGLKEGSFRFPRPTHGPDSPDGAAFYNAGTAVEGVQSGEPDDSNRLGGRYAHLLADIPPGLNYSFYTEKMGHPNPLFAWRSKFSDFLYKADPGTPVRTIKASGGAYTGPLHWENRFFNYEEYKRLQTFPDDYEISGTKPIAVKQIGNSVPPQLARIMAVAIRMQVFRTEFPFSLSFLEDGEKLTFRKRKSLLTAVYRKKAAAAIRAAGGGRGAPPGSHEYFCSIRPNFRFRRAGPEDADFKVTVEWGQTLHITTGDAAGNAGEEVITVHIIPRGGIWALGVEKVVLSVRTTAPLSYPATWKAFERELTANAIKADLVQLNGYYHYIPKLVCGCFVADTLPHAGILKKVVEENTVPSILTTEQLAEKWETESDAVLGAAQYLKSIGYEIRNHSTNPQIDEGSWLIPYAFPTLTPLSVQLGKKLA